MESNYDECDILIVGGGCVGHSTALAAARAGAKLQLQAPG